MAGGCQAADAVSVVRKVDSRNTRNVETKLIAHATVGECGRSTVDGDGHADERCDGYLIIAIGCLDGHRRKRGNRKSADKCADVGSVTVRAGAGDVVANVYRNFDIGAVEADRYDVVAAARATSDQ